MNIKILGSGCANCKKLEENAKEAVRAAGMDAVIEKVQDFKEIARYGVMKTPALVVDEKVKSMGKVLTSQQIREILK